MKKLLSLLFLTFISYTLFANATVTQKDWRWRKDNGTETTANWHVNENQGVEIPSCKIDETIRLRVSFLVEFDPASPSNPAFKDITHGISYSNSPTGTFTQITTDGSMNHFKLASSIYESNVTTTTQQLSTTGGPYVNGKFYDAGSSVTVNFVTSAGVNSIVEHEWVLVPTANATFQTYYFKLEDLNGYSTLLPSLTISGITNQTFTADVSTFCGTGSSNINLASSEAGINYYLRNDLNDAVVSGPLVGTGSGISFNTGTISTTTTYNVLGEKSYAVSDYALDFDGVNDKVTVPDQNSIDPTSNFTLEAWIKFSASQPNYAGIIAKGEGGHPWIGYQLVLVNNMLAAEIFDGTNFVGVDQGLTGTSALNDGAWHHVAMVYEGSGTKIQLLVDGIVQANVTSPGIGNLSNNNDLYIGAERTSGAFFNGQIDEVRIWNVARTETEIANNSDGCFSGAENGLVGFYSFNNGPNSSIVTDLAGSDNNGSLDNMDFSTDWVAGTVNCPLICEQELTGTVTVTINQLPAVTANASDTEICNGGQVTLTGGGAVSYVWDNSVTDNTAFSPTGTVTYTVTGTDANNCTNTASVEVEVNNLPTVTANASDTEICAGDQVTLTGGGADTYVWDNNVIDNTAFLPTGTLTYNVTGTDANGCSNTASATIDVTTVDVSISISENVITANAAGLTYQWVDCNNNVTPIANETGQSFTAILDGSYAVEVTTDQCTKLSYCVPIITTDLIGTDNTNRISIHPNPNNGSFILEVSSAITIEVYSPVGQLLFTKEVSEGRNNIELENAGTGIYYITSVDEKGNRTNQRIVVTR